MLCDDGNPCTTDSCTNGQCTHVQTTSACDDGNACTTGDTCTAGVCKGATAVTCNDGDPCTADGCDPKKGCIATLANAFSGGASQYFVCKSARHWDQAEAYCVSKGYHLASIGDATEQSNLNTKLASLGIGATWIGFNDLGGWDNEGKFVWVGGGSTSYKAWCEGEPNNSWNEDCVVMGWCEGGKWNDVGCDESFGFLCEK